MTGTWRTRAACRDADAEIFFPVAVRGQEYEAQVSAAKAVCAGCPVLADCLTWALGHLPDGIAGGMTEHERRAELARRRHSRRNDRLPKPRTPRRPVGGSRAEIAAAGRDALAAGLPVAEVAARFLVTARTAERWAAAVHAPPDGTTVTSGPDVAEGSTGGHRAPLQISHTATQAGTRAEGNRA